MSQNKLTKNLGSAPYFLFLLPLFFVLHGFTENFSAVPVKDALYLVFIYLVAAAILLFLSWLLLRNVSKAALLAFCLLAFQFFFGSMQDFLKRVFGDAFWTRYSFILPFFLVVFILLAIALKRRHKNTSTLNFYLNSLLLLIIIIDVISLLGKIISRDRSRPSASKEFTIRCDTCTRPDIFFLLFDEYSSSTALNELWHFNNSELDNYLVQKGFSIQPYSTSNYNFTPFSIASTLNMEYLDIRNAAACTLKDYENCSELIRKNRVCSLLQSLGYRIINYSIFDLDKNPSPVMEDFLPLKTRLITAQTFLSRIQKDLLFHLLVGKFEIPWLTKNMIYTTYNNNEKIINNTLREAAMPSSAPRFVYSHIEMPHPPFYYNNKGRQMDKRILIDENNRLPADAYLEYIPRTNEVIRHLVDTILTKAKRPVVVILMGDHGFRTKQPHPYHFRNQNAVYISYKQAAGFYPHMSNVNEFRILFNDLFQTSFPLLKDSSQFLIDK